MSAHNATGERIADLSVDHRLTIDRDGESYVLTIKPIGRWANRPTHTYRGPKLATVVVTYDVSAFTDGEIAVLSGEAEAQAEASDYESDANPGHPDCPVTVSTRPAIAAGCDLTISLSTEDLIALINRRPERLGGWIALYECMTGCVYFSRPGRPPVWATPDWEEDGIIAWQVADDEGGSFPWPHAERSVESYLALVLPLLASVELRALAIPEAS
jgi:hypothetical protein